MSLTMPRHVDRQTHERTCNCNYIKFPWYGLYNYIIQFILCTKQIYINHGMLQSAKVVNWNSHNKVRVLTITWYVLCKTFFLHTTETI